MPMNIYNSNIQYLLDKQNTSITEFERIIHIAKVRIMDPTIPELIRISDHFNIPMDVLILKDLRTMEKFDKTQFKLVILDVDGTMTDGGMYFAESGDQFKKYNTKDGLAIKRLVREGIHFGIISHGKKLKVVKDRADLLGIQHVYVGDEVKSVVLRKWLNELNIELNEVAYVGDDINDLEIIEQVGMSACPGDAVDAVKRKVDIILRKEGGRGCVREFLDEWLS